MKKAVNDFIVLDNIALNAANFLIRLRSPVPLPEIMPGQFANVEVKNSTEIFLRRPFSVFDVNYEEQTLGLIVKILGRGSKILTGIKPKETLSLVYPLGKGFTTPDRNDRILLIGGGSGVAPLLFLAKTAGLKYENVHIVLGAKNADDIIDIREYRKYGQVDFTTEDGSLGVYGRVTDHPLFKEGLTTFNKVYTCGPEPMMKSIASVTKECGIFCEVSLENLMACGFGVCLCCIEPTIRGNLCVCTDGPVFNINTLKW